MQCSRLLYPFAWLPRRAKHHGQKVTRLSDFENCDEWNGQSTNGQTRVYDVTESRDLPAMWNRA